MHLTQPAVSRHVARLERALGVRLFNRSSRRVELTAEAGVLLDEGRRLLEAGSLVLDRVAAVATDRAGVLVVGGAEPLVAALLPRLLPAAHRELPGTSVRVRELRDSDLTSALAEGRIDVGLTLAGAATPDLSATRVMTDQWVAVLAADHPAATRTRAALSVLIDRPLAIHRRAWAPAWYDTVIEMCGALPIAPTLVYDDVSMHTRLALIAAGTAVGIMPRQFAAASANVRIVGLAPAVPATIVAVHRRPRAQNVRDFCAVATRVMARQPRADGDRRLSGDRPS